MPHPDRLRTPSILLLIAAGLGVQVSFAGALLFFGLGIASLINPLEFSAYPQELIGLGWTALVTLAVQLPVLVFASRRLNQRPIPEWPANGLKLASIGLAVWAVALIAGAWAAEQPYAWLALPPLQVLVVVLPLWWLVEVGRRGIRAGSQQRTWSLLGVSLAVTVPLTLILEIVIFGILIILLSAWLLGQPDTARQLRELVQQLQIYGPDPQILERALQPLQNQAWLRGGVLISLAGIVPLFEELLKPLALWGMARWRLRPAEGFVAGLTCGAGFALLETLTALTSSPAEAWQMLAVQRVGTGLLHIVTTGLVGWGLATAWSRQRYLALAFAFLSAVGLHAAWNTAGLGFLPGFSGQPIPGLNLAAAQVISLLVLMGVMLTILFVMNRRLAGAPAEIPAMPAESLQ